MVSLFGRGFDSLQLHYFSPSRGLTLVRVLSVASLCESGKAERDSSSSTIIKRKAANPQRVSGFSSIQTNQHLHSRLFPDYIV